LGKPDYRRWLPRPLRLNFVTVAPVSRDILIEAARLRAQHPTLKLPDAIHAASVIAYQSAYFISNDARFRQLTQFQTVALAMEQPQWSYYRTTRTRG
jgi:predicted nucleic acid-binding protein